MVSSCENTNSKNEKESNLRVFGKRHFPFYLIYMREFDENE